MGGITGEGGGGGKPLVPKTGPLDESFGTDMAKHSL
jgi:hypothetical protein